MTPPAIDPGHFATWAGWVASALAGSLVAWKILSPHLAAWHTALKGLPELLATNKAVLANTETIAKELVPNDGASMRDAMTRLEYASVIRDAYSKSIWTAMEQALFKASPAGQITELNRDFLALVGRHESELIGLGWLNVFPQSERAAIAAEWSDCVKQKRFFEMPVTVAGNPYTLKAEPIMVGSELLGWAGSLTIKLNGIEGRLRTIEKAVGEKQ